MKTTTTYPENAKKSKAILLAALILMNAKKAKAILVAAIILIQASLIANDSSGVNQNYNETTKADSEYTKISAALKSENAYYSINEEASEAEYKIEDWMYNIHDDVWNNDAIEDEPELEEWMCNPNSSFWFDLGEAKEKEQAIESWMTNLNEWTDTSDDFMLSSK